MSLLISPAIFSFRFAPDGSHVAICCSRYPPLNGRDASVSKTHIFDSGELCFVSGKEPRTQARAEELAAMWAEYYLQYRITGIAQD